MKEDERALARPALVPDRITIGEAGAQRLMHAQGLSCGLRSCVPCERKKTELVIDLVYRDLFGDDADDENG